MKNPGRTSERLASIAEAEPLRTGIGMFVTYLIMNGLVLFLTFKSVAGQLPDHLAEAYAQVFSVVYIGMILGVTLGEIVIFVLGWLYVMIAVALLNGKRRHRALFGWLGVAYTPVTVYSIMAVAFMLVFSDQMVYAGLSTLATLDQLPAEIMKMQDTGLFEWIRFGPGLCFDPGCRFGHRSGAQGLFAVQVQGSRRDSVLRRSERPGTGHYAIALI